MNTWRKNYYYGAAYYAEYLPYDRVEKDMAMMKAAGMNVIRIAESTWSTLEPARGIYDFSYIDCMLNAAQQNDIAVIVGTPTYAVPAWLVKEHPDVLAITFDGPNRYGPRQNMDLTNLHYRSAAKSVIQALISHVRDNPNVIGYQLDNETKSYGTAGKNVQALFVSYLKARWPNLNDFNEQFGLSYWSNRVNSWEEFPDISETINGSLAAEFKRFQRKLVTDFLDWQAEIVTPLKRPDQFLTHNFDFDWVQERGYGMQPEVDQKSAAAGLDVAGCDIYHLSQGDFSGLEIALNGNLIRGLKRDNYLVLETQAQGLSRRTPFPGQVRLATFNHFANGANMVEYWHWHSIHNAIESYWKGVVSHDFSAGETYRECQTVGLDLQRIGAHITGLKKKNHVALLLDISSLTGLTLFSPQEENTHCYNDIVHHFADVLYRKNVEFDVIYPQDCAHFSDYDFLVVPALYSMSDALKTALDDYVNFGGHLVATFKTGFSDSYLKIRHAAQPYGLTRCFGLSYDQFTIPAEMTLSDNQKNPMGNATLWAEFLELSTAEPIAHYQTPPEWNGRCAIAQNNYGKGASLYYGTLPAPEETSRILMHFMEDCGHPRPYALDFRDLNQFFNVGGFLPQVQRLLSFQLMDLGEVPYDLIIPCLVFQKAIIKSPQFTHLDPYSRQLYHIW